MSKCVMWLSSRLGGEMGEVHSGLGFGLWKMSLRLMGRACQRYLRICFLYSISKVLARHVPRLKRPLHSLVRLGAVCR